MNSELLEEVTSREEMKREIQRLEAENERLKKMVYVWIKEGQIA